MTTYYTIATQEAETGNMRRVYFDSLEAGRLAAEDIRRVSGDFVTLEAIQLAKVPSPLYKMLPAA